MPIERATHGAVTRPDLRPDDYLIHWPELAEAHHQPAPDELTDELVVEAIQANLIKDRRVSVRRADDRKRLGLDVGSAGKGG